MEGLGREFNVIVEAQGVYVNLRDYGAVTFICYEDGGDSTFTIGTSTAASGGTELTGDIIDHYYESDGVGGTWALVTQTAAETVEPGDTTDEDCVAIYVSGDMLPDGHSFVKCTRDEASGTGPDVVAVLHDLKVQRNPANLASPIV